MRRQESEEEVRPATVMVSPVAPVLQGREIWSRTDPGAGQLNWRAGYLLCIGTAVGYTGAAVFEAVVTRM